MLGLLSRLSNHTRQHGTTIHYRLATHKEPTARPMIPPRIPHPTHHQSATYRRIAAVLAVLVTCASALPAQPPAGKPVHDIKALAWMAGCWEQRAAGRVTQEHWMAPSGGTMIGMSRTVAGGATRGWEFLRIAYASGTLTYIAQPSGQAETAFAASSVSDTLVAFDNPTHDFPQRIVYRRVTPDSVVARISAVRNGQTRAMDIPMARTRCLG